MSDAPVFANPAMAEMTATPNALDEEWLERWDEY